MLGLWNKGWSHKTTAMFGILLSQWAGRWWLNFRTASRLLRLTLIMAVCKPIVQRWLGLRECNKLANLFLIYSSQASRRHRYLLAVRSFLDQSSFFIRAWDGPATYTVGSMCNQREFAQNIMIMIIVTQIFKGDPIHLRVAFTGVLYLYTVP